MEDHFEDFEQVYDERFERTYRFYRPYLRSVIYRYLDCGILHNGFAQVRRGECDHEYLLAFSCKRRHFCASCHQKRVVEFGKWACGEVLKRGQGDVAENRDFTSLSHETGIPMAEIARHQDTWEYVVWISCP